MLPKEVWDMKDDIIQYLDNIQIPVSDRKDENIMLRVFVHKSYAADQKEDIEFNERLEFLWDWILGAIINKNLFLDHPEMAESKLTLYKIALVREEILAEVARDINLWSQLFISKWEEKMQWRNKDSILSDALEALIGYLYLDYDISVVESFIKKYVYVKFDKVDTKPVKSYKTLIQETIQKESKTIPEYKDIENKLDDKNNVIEYKSEIWVLWEKKSEWFGTNKKKAQEDAAKSYYLKLNDNN